MSPHSGETEDDRRRGTKSGLSMKGEREDVGPFPISTHSIYDFESLHVRKSLGKKNRKHRRQE